MSLVMSEGALPPAIAGPHDGGDGLTSSLLSNIAVRSAEILESITESLLPAGDPA